MPKRHTQREQVETERAPAPIGAFSQGVCSGAFVYTAGQGPTDPGTGATVGSTIEEQTERALTNIAAILAEAGADLEDVVKATVHLSDLALFPGFDTTYRKFFNEPYPVRTTVGSQLPGILVEIDVIAFVGPDAHAAA